VNLSGEEKRTRRKDRIVKTERRGCGKKVWAREEKMEKGRKQEKNGKRKEGWLAGWLDDRSGRKETTRQIAAKRYQRRQYLVGIQQTTPDDDSRSPRTRQRGTGNTLLLHPTLAHTLAATLASTHIHG
jgi:hypothetical protein